MVDATAVAVGLDVHKVSIRLAAVRADELLEERTLAYDVEAVERAVGRWPGARVCYEAGPTGCGLYRHLVACGIACDVVAPGSVPARPGDRVKTDRRDARKLARLHAGGLLDAIWCPTSSLRRCAISFARARTRGWIGCAIAIARRSSCCVTSGGCPASRGASSGASG